MRKSSPNITKGIQKTKIMLLESSKEIIEKAIIDFKPKAKVLMLSGGDDSMAAMEVCKELGVEIDFIIHGNTRTGIEETTEFARKQAEVYGIKYLEADAGDAYEKYVLRKGFFGVGVKAHAMAYHVLKINHFRKVVSANLRQRQRNFPILFINGARRLESENRKKTMLNPYKFDPAQKNNIWVNIINEWDNGDPVKYLEGNGVKRNPVSVALCRSGECLCGTMQSAENYAEAKEYDPKWGERMEKLRNEVKKKFPWDWGENPPKSWNLEKNGQGNLFTGFQPMCTGCKINAKK